MLSLCIFVSFYMFYPVIVMHTDKKTNKPKTTARLEESQSTEGSLTNDSTH